LIDKLENKNLEEAEEKVILAVINLKYFILGSWKWK